MELIDQFDYEHKTYGTVSVELNEYYNESSKQQEFQAWAIYFKEHEECHTMIYYPKEKQLSKTKIKNMLNKEIN